MDFRKTEETDKSFKGVLTIENPNAVYQWNETCFNVKEIRFDCTSTVNLTLTTGGSVSFSQVDGKVTANLGYLSIFPASTKVEVNVVGTKAGDKVLPVNFLASYVRNDEIPYPAYGELPATFQPGKADLQLKDLIRDTDSYYSPGATPIQEKLIVHQAYHPTQVWLGQPKALSHVISDTRNVRIWIPNKYLAMGVGFVYEMFKINPNFLVALGTKENFSCGLVPAAGGGVGEIIVLEGEKYVWPYQFVQDGPFQQETPNFNDTVVNFPDFYPKKAAHDDYVFVKDRNDPKYASAAIASGISITATRESLYSIEKCRFHEFVAKAKDPWAEFSLIDYAYNRGLNNLLSLKIFTDKREASLAAEDVAKANGMAGVGDHLTQIRHCMTDMNNDIKSQYNEFIEWQDFSAFLGKVKLFYANGQPSTEQWAAMNGDLKKAFDLLAAHWGGGKISYRFDFLTLVRVMKAHLPKPFNPRPTGEAWYYLIKGAKP